MSSVVVVAVVVEFVVVELVVELVVVEAEHTDYEFVGLALQNRQGG